jgi:hypothetical protein
MTTKITSYTEHYDVTSDVSPMRSILMAIITSLPDVDPASLCVDPLTGAINVGVIGMPGSFSIFYGKANDLFHRFALQDIQRHFRSQEIDNDGFAVQGPLPPVPFRTFGELQRAIRTVYERMTDFGVGMTFPDDEEVTGMKHIMAAVRLESRLREDSVTQDTRNCLTVDFVGGPRGRSAGIAIWAAARSGGPTVEGGYGPNYFETFGELKAAVRRATKQAFEGKEDVDEEDVDEEEAPPTSDAAAAVSTSGGAAAASTSGGP